MDMGLGFHGVKGGLLTGAHCAYPPFRHVTSALVMRADVFCAKGEALCSK